MLGSLAILSGVWKPQKTRRLPIKTRPPPHHRAVGGSTNQEHIPKLLQIKSWSIGCLPYAGLPHLVLSGVTVSQLSTYNNKHILQTSPCIPESKSFTNVLDCYNHIKEFFFILASLHCGIDAAFFLKVISFFQFTWKKWFVKIIICETNPNGLTHVWTINENVCILYVEYLVCWLIRGIESFHTITKIQNNPFSNRILYRIFQNVLYFIKKSSIYLWVFWDIILVWDADICMTSHQDPERTMWTGNCVLPWCTTI